MVLLLENPFENINGLNIALKVLALQSAIHYFISIVWNLIIVHHIEIPVPSVPGVLVVVDPKSDQVIVNNIDHFDFKVLSVFSHDEVLSCCLYHVYHKITMELNLHLGSYQAKSCVESHNFDGCFSRGRIFIFDNALVEK